VQETGCDTLLLTVTARFKHYNAEEIRLFSNSHTFAYEKFKRYLNIFSKLNLLVRSKECTNIPDNSYEATGESVIAIPLHYFEGPWQFAIRYLRIRRQLAEILYKQESASLIFRLPCPIGILAISVVKRGRPYAVEVVGDPRDVFSIGAVRHILLPFLKIYFVYALRKACENAIAALYVTKNALQERYPCPNGMFSASNINLSEKEICEQPRQFEHKSKMHIIFVGTMSQLYKAPDILLKAFKICVREGKDLHLTMLGDGKYRPKLEKLAGKLGISERVSFLGMVPKEEVFKRLDESDLFVLPSKTEGLPRAMIEAMARGLPCIGTTVGGIPELLPPEDLVPPGDVKALAAKIMEVINDPERMAKMSERNLAKAKEYKEDILQREREAFYSLVKKRTEEWIMRNKGN
jgi:glycosyltransferase involved in cell wall biosynthesis